MASASSAVPAPTPGAVISQASSSANCTPIPAAIHVPRLRFAGRLSSATAPELCFQDRHGNSLGVSSLAAGANCGYRQQGVALRASLVPQNSGGRRSLRAGAQVQENAPGNSPTEGVSIYKPASYDVIVSVEEPRQAVATQPKIPRMKVLRDDADAAKAVVHALDDGKIRLESSKAMYFKEPLAASSDSFSYAVAVAEMEYSARPLPNSSGYKESSDQIIDANVQLAFTMARKLNQSKGLTTRIVFPDGPEKRRALRVFKSALEFTACVTFGSLDDLPADIRGAARDFFGQIKGFFDFDFSEDNKGENTSTPDIYVIVNASTNELPSVREFINYFAKDTPVVLFNLETDTLRADLGLFGFPSKAIHYTFLTLFQPVFYIRTRDYSKNVPAAPFLVNYSGALFRQYPGPWQVMLKQVDGSYACVAERAQRFTLFQVKEELLISLGLQEIEGSTMAFLRSGYKKSTWWEANLEPEESAEWRS